MATKIVAQHKEDFGDSWAFRPSPSSSILGTRRFGNLVCYHPQVRGGKHPHVQFLMRRVL
jgi:hypothetical protein